MIIPYDASKEERDRIVKERERKLYESFEHMRKDIDDQIQNMNFSTVSERVKRQQLEEIRNSLQKQLQSHYNALESGLKDDMVNIGQDVLKESESFYASLNMPIGMSITSFPVEIMNNVVNGSVYQEKWYLSRALWGDYTEKLDQINEVISNGIGLNLPSKEIAKQLEQYVDPSAMTPSKTIVTKCLQDPVTGKLYSMDYVKRHPEKDWTGFKEKDSKFRYGKVDYNAQRLARTLINHAYQQNVVHQAQANPFATGVRWDASGGERMCEICEERDGKIFPTDDVPLDHPNGMCTFEVITDLNMMEMSDVLADFVNGEPTEYDDALYAWYNDRAEVPIERAPDMFAQHVIAEGRDISGEWQRRPDQYDFEIEDVMAAQGFDGLPRVVSKEEFEAAVKAANDGNGFIAQRTYVAGDQETLDMYRDMLYNGKWYVDCGTGGAQYGQGMYCAADYSGQLTQGIQNEMHHYQDINSQRLSKDLDREKVLDKVLHQLSKDGVDQNTADTIVKIIDVNVYGADYDRRSLLSSLDRNAKTKVAEFTDLITFGDFAKASPVSYIETLTLDPSAKIISYDDAYKLRSDYESKFKDSKITNFINTFSGDERYVAARETRTKIDGLEISEIIRKAKEYEKKNGPDAYDKLAEIVSAKRNEIEDEWYSYGRKLDEGAVAVLYGYDAINAEGHGESGSYTVILNRTKLIIQGDE